MKNIKKKNKTKIFKAFLLLFIIALIAIPTFLTLAAGKSKFTIEAVTNSDKNPEPVNLMKLHRNDEFRLKINLETSEVYQALTYAITYDNRYFELVEAWKYSDNDNRGNSKIEGDYNSYVDKENPNLTKLIFAVAVNSNYGDNYSYNGTVGTAIFKVKQDAKGSCTFTFTDDTALNKEIADGYYDASGEYHGAKYEQLNIETVNANAFVEIPVDDITLKVDEEVNPTKINMIGGTTKQIEVIPNNTDTTMQANISYSSSKAEIANVSNSGVITANKTGTTEIIVKAYGLTKKFTVNVTNPIKKLYFNDESVTIQGENKTKTLQVEMEPANPDNAQIKWESLNEDIATVDQNGVVTSHKAGTCVIKVTSKADSSISANITVKVISSIIPVEEVSINPKEISLEKNATQDITITYKPLTATTDVTLSVEDKNIASISKETTSSGTYKATVKGLSGGKTNIKAKLTNCKNSVNCEFTIPVSVNVPLKGIKIQKDNNDITSLSIYPTEKVTLKVVTDPLDATGLENEVISWKSSNDNVQVENGVVTGINPNTSAVITATYANHETSITVNVKTPVEGGNLSPSNDINLITKCDSKKGKCQEQMQVIFFDANGKTPDEKPTVTWGIKQGNSTDVVSINSTGLVKALKAGSTIITATYKTFDGQIHTLEANVNVIVALESLSFEKDSLTVHRGKTVNLPKLVLNPKDAYVNIEEVEYEYDPTIISLENNIITGIKKGTTTIKAKLGDEFAELSVVVDVPIEDIIVKLNDKEITNLLLERSSSCVLTASIIPNDADNQNVIWSIADGSAKDIISINSETGAINALKKGKTKVSVKAGNIEKIIEVEVNVPVKTFTADEKLDIYKGESNKKTISTVIDPIDADNQEITWKSNNEEIATVDEFGTVTGHKAGSTTIIGTLENGMQVSVLVTVSIIPLTDIDVVVPNEILKGRTTSLKITPNPTNTTEFENIEYESTDEEIFVVDDSGNITGLKQGTATLIIRVGEVTKEVEITITEIHADSIDVHVPSDKLGVSEEMLLQPFTNPENCTDELTYTFTSSDEHIATVSEDGTVKGISEGTVTIKVTASNGMEKEVKITITKEAQFRQEETIIPNTNTQPLVPSIILSIMSLLGIITLGYKRYTLNK